MKEPARLVYEFGPFRLEPTERRLFCQDQIVPLTPKALDLLTVFVEQSDHLIDKETLLKAVWEESFVEKRTSRTQCPPCGKRSATRVSRIDISRRSRSARRVLDGDPTSAQGHVTLGSVYMLTGRKDLPSMTLKRALELQPRSTEASIWLGNLHLMNGEFPAARQSYTGVLADNPLVWPARGLLGLALSFEGQFEAAAREVEKILEQDRINVEALSHLVTFAWQQGDLGRAREGVERALKLQPANYRTRLLHGVQLALDGEREQALREVNSSVNRYARVNIRPERSPRLVTSSASKDRGRRM